ncbi:MAG: hypothetical protein QG653_488 [Patescibacteria group bacterium]|nr:hypothetical protein [Patescibacteria group bacterium]
MYQLLLIMALLLSVGGALVTSISRGSVARAYTSLSSPTTFDVVEDDTVKRTFELAEADSKDDSLVSAVFKSIIGVESEVKASPMLTRTITGTYACDTASTTTNPPCENTYIFVFKPNTAAVLRIEATDGTITTTQVGTWFLNDEGQIVATLFADGEGRFEEERRFTLLRGRKAQLITIEYPHDFYPNIVTGVFKFVKK